MDESQCRQFGGCAGILQALLRAQNNATIAIVGDFKTDEALAKVKKYFESIPAQPAPPRPDISQPNRRPSGGSPGRLLRAVSAHRHRLPDPGRR